MTHTVRIVIHWPGGLDEEAAFEFASATAQDLAAQHPEAHMTTYIEPAADPGYREAGVNADETGTGQRPACGETRAHDWLKLICSRPEGHDGNHVDRARRASWTGAGPATDLDGRPLLKGTLPPNASDPRAFRRRRSAARRDT